VKLSVFTVILLALAESVVSSQWIHFKADGVPRLRSGEPDLNAPVPRAANNMEVAACRLEDISDTPNRKTNKRLQEARWLLYIALK